MRRASLSNWNPFPLDSLDLINPAFCPFREDAWAFKPDAFFASNYSSCQYLDFGKSTPYLSRPTQLIFILDFYTHKYKRHNRAICYTYLGIPAHLHIFKCVSSCKDLDSGKSSPYLQHWGRWSTPHLRLSNDLVILHQIAPAVNIWILGRVFQIWAREPQSFLEFQLKLYQSPLDSAYNLISHSVSEEELQNIALTVALESRVVCVTVAWMKSQENSAAVAASPVLIVQLEMLALLHCPTLVWIWIFKFQWNTLVTPGSKSHKSQKSLRGGGTFAFASLDLDLQMAVTHTLVTPG